MSESIRVLVVDDSSFIRNAIANMLVHAPDIALVGTASDGREALEKVEALHPDVMTLDIDMPGLDGLEVLAHVMAHSPLPVIMVSSLTDASATETMRALELGAVDFLPKQQGGSILELSKLEQVLLTKIRAAAWARGKVHGWACPTAAAPQPSPQAAADGGHNASSSKTSREDPSMLVVIGASTGGPVVVQELLSALPASVTGPILVVQHMPEFFTSMFAARLNEGCPLDVCEAKEADVLRPGKVYVANGGHHIRVKRREPRGGYLTLSKEPVELSYRPSVDVAMESAVDVFGSKIVGVVLTGMGNDGERGMKAIKHAGGATLAQDEATSVVFGMPKAVINAGAADAVVSNTLMPTYLERMVRKVREAGTETAVEYA